MRLGVDVVDESELRAHLTHADGPSIAIDTESVIARSRARRRPRRAAVGAVGILAAASLVFAGVQTFQQPELLSTATGTADDAPETARLESDAGMGAPEAQDFAGSGFPEICGSTIETQAASPLGLSLELELPAQTPASGSVYGTVRLLNTSDVAVTGTTAAVPDLNLVRDDVVLSHSPDAQILSLLPVNLQPGQSIEFDVAIAVYDCTMSDSGGMIEPGSYVAIATLAFAPEDSSHADTAQVRSDPVTIALQ